MSPVEPCRIPLLLVILVATGQVLVGATKPSRPEGTTSSTKESVDQVESLSLMVHNIKIEYERQIQDMKDEFKAQTAALKEGYDHQMLNIKDELNHLIEVLREEHHDQIIINQRQEKMMSKLTDQMESYPAVYNAHVNYTSLTNNIIYFQVHNIGFVGSPSEDSLIPFDVITLNEGSGYDPASRLFTAPVNGFYHIAYEVLTDGSCGTGHMCVKLFVNAGVVSWSCSDAYASGGSGVTLQLVAGDTVGVKTDLAAPCKNLNSNSAVFNNFGGFLIYQII